MRMIIYHHHHDERVSERKTPFSLCNNFLDFSHSAFGGIVGELYLCGEEVHPLRFVSAFEGVGATT